MRTGALQNSRNTLTPEFLKSILEYDENDIWRWKVNRPPRGKAGKEAGYVGAKGFRYIAINGILHLSSSLKLFMETGEWERKCSCDVCGATFIGFSLNDKFCSQPCRLANNRARDAMRAPKERERRRAYAAQYRKDNPEKVAAAIKRALSTPEGRARKAAYDTIYHQANKERANANVTANYRRSRVERPWYILLFSAKSRAKKKGQPFDLTHGWAEKRWTGKCEITKIPFKVANMRNSGHYFAPTIDKIEPSLGYIQENCRFVILAINCFKHDATDEDMLHVATELLLNYPADQP